jgi:hypothetical protein
MGNVKPCIRFGNCQYYQCAPVGAPELTALTQECRTTGCADENRDCSCMKLSARGTIDVCEAFINASFVPVKKEMLDWKIETLFARLQNLKRLVIR